MTLKLTDNQYGPLS